jgi:hypothetical protein
LRKNKKEKAPMTKLPAWDMIWWSFDAPATHLRGLLRRLSVSYVVALSSALLMLNGADSVEGPVRSGIILLFFGAIALLQANLWAGTPQVILGLPERSSLIRLKGPELRTLLWFAALYLGFGLVLLVFVLIGMAVVGPDFANTLDDPASSATLSEKLTILAGFGFAMFLYAWVFLRMTPMFALIAVENKIAIRKCWALTRKSSIRILWLLFVLSLVAGFVLVPAQLFYAFSRGNLLWTTLAMPIFLGANVAVGIMFASASTLIYQHLQRNLESTEDTNVTQQLVD